MGFLKAIGIGIVVYLGGVFAVLLIPVLVILCLWGGVCVLGSIFLLVLWLVTHNAHTLAMSGAMLAWGAPPFVGAFLLGYYGGQLRARHRALKLTLSQDAPFR